MNVDNNNFYFKSVRNGIMAMCCHGEFVEHFSNKPLTKLFYRKRVSSNGNKSKTMPGNRLFYCLGYIYDSVKFEVKPASNKYGFDINHVLFYVLLVLYATVMLQRMWIGLARRCSPFCRNCVVRCFCRKKNFWIL